LRREDCRRKILSGQSGIPRGVQDGSDNSPDDDASLGNDCQALVLHPWTGVSTNVQGVFGLAVLLCREHRKGNKNRGIGTQAALLDALCNIELARELEAELLGMHFDYQADDGVPTMFETGDEQTPAAHLLSVAEAYRLAGLLHLYQTFPDLEVVKSDTSGPWHDAGNDGSSRDTAILELTLKLVAILRNIPAASGTRCIQPILYITAASGLRFDVAVEDSRSSSLAGVAPQAGPFLAQTLTKCTLEVSKARRFIVNRLCALHSSLPPRPIAVALNLVKAIWAEYDREEPSCEPKHWIDVMVDKGLQTLFG
jgi:hypothetical protein